MNKNLLISLVVILVLLGGLAYWQYNSKPAINNNENTNVDNVNSNNNAIDTSGWDIFEDKRLKLSYKYPTDKYEIQTYFDSNDNETYYQLVSRDTEDRVITFYTHPNDYLSPSRGAYFGDVNGFIYEEGIYKIVYGSQNKKNEVVVLDRIDSDLGEIIIIDGTKFNYNAPNVGPGSDYAAVINLDNNPLYNGIAIKPDDDIISYDEFLEMMKSIKSI